MRQVESGNELAHRDEQQRQRQRDAGPEPAGHVIELGRVLFGRGQQRFQRHAANGAIAGTDLPYLGVHRTGIDCIFGSGRRRSCRRRMGSGMFVQVAIRIGPEPGHAALAAKVKGLAIVLDCFFRIGGDFHFADRVDMRFVRRGGTGSRAVRAARSAMCFVRV